MTDAEAIELGRIVAAWDGFRWVAGIRRLGSGRPARIYGERTERPVSDIGLANRFRDRNDDDALGVPDLRDRPTQAAVLEQIEKALSAPCHIQPTAYFVTDNGRKCWRVHCAGVFAHAGSRAEAIAAAVRELSADPPWYLNEQTRETGERWPGPCAYFINLDPDEYPDQPGCDRCGHPKSEGHR